MLDPFADQSPSDDAFEHDYSICTPPRLQSLEDRLLDTTPEELQALLEKVLEKRPELRAKLTETKRPKPEPKPVETVEWDAELIGNHEMCRDDKGGWVKASEVSKHRIVGTDFRGLPIVHIGRGRHNAKIVKLLQNNPDGSSEPITEPMEPDVGAEVNSTEAEVGTEATAKVPRTSARLQKKKLRLCTSKTEKLEGTSTDLDTLDDNVDTKADDGLASDDAITKCDTPPEMVEEVSISTSEVKMECKCSSCHLTFESAGRLKKHVISPDCVGFSSKCYMCQLQFSDVVQLQAHELHHCYQQICVTARVGTDQWAKARFRCSLCGAGRTTEQEMISHARISHASAPVFRCRLCQQSYHDLQPLQKHFSKQHVSRIKQCTICGKMLNSRLSLQAHMRRQHSNNSPFTCLVCSKQLMSKRSLQNHMKSMHENDRPFKCQHCGKAFISQFMLDAHSKVHSNVKDFTCGICGATFRQKVRLTEHLRAHAGVKDFVCSICKKAFYARKDLTSHERSHKNLKTYICEHCGNAYSQVQGLNRHLLTHSEPNQLFKCQFCTKSFKTAGAVYRHCRLAHGDKMTAYCSICCLTFVSNADLNRHNHYKHMSMYDGRVEERTFLSFTAQATDISSHSPVGESLPLPPTSFQCMCGDSFTDMNLLAEHINSVHHDQISPEQTGGAAQQVQLSPADIDSPPTSCPTVHRLLYSPDDHPASSQPYVFQFPHTSAPMSEIQPLPTCQQQR